MTEALALTLAGFTLIACGGGAIGRAKSESVLFRLSIVAYLLLWMVVPAIAGVYLHFFGFPLEPAFSSVFFIESVSVSLGILIFLKIKSKRPVTENVYTNRKLVYLAVILFSYYLLAAGGKGYLESNDISSGLESGVIPFFAGIVGGLVIYTAMQSKENPIFFTALACVFFYCLVTLASGGRMILLLPLFIIVYRTIRERNGYLKKIFASVFLVSTLSVSVYLSLAIEKTRAGGVDLSLSDFGDASFVLTNTLGSVFQKLNSFNAGSELIDGYGAGSAGITPYLGSLLFPIPRVVFPDKPVPGSVNSDRSGTPGRLVPALINPFDTINNVGVSPLAVSVWHWGWSAGTFVFLISFVCNLNLLKFCLDSNYLIMRVLAVTLIPIPGFVNVVPSPDVFLKNFITVTFFYISVKTLKMLSLSTLRARIGG